MFSPGSRGAGGVSGADRGRVAVDVSTVILPVAFLVISWPVVWYKLYRTNDITPEMRSFPLYKFAIMGLFDTLFNLFSTFPIYHLGSDLSNILSQSVLPINMLGSMIFLRTRYRKVRGRRARAEKRPVPDPALTPGTGAPAPRRRTTSAPPS